MSWGPKIQVNYLDVRVHLEIHTTIQQLAQQHTLFLAVFRFVVWCIVVYLYVFSIFLPKTCFGWHFGMYRGFEILTECIEVFIHCMVHTLYASYIVWFSIVWGILLSRIVWRSLPYIVWWRASGAASSDVPRNGLKEPWVASGQKLIKFAGPLAQGVSDLV